jgi:hypothetical protein
LSKLRTIALDHCAFDIRGAFEWKGEEFRVSIVPRRDVSDTGPVRPQLKSAATRCSPRRTALARDLLVDFRVGLRYSSEVLMYQRFVR